MANILPLTIDESPRSVTSDTTSQVGQLQESVKTWAQEISLALRSMSTSLQTLQQSPASGSTTTVVKTQTTSSGGAQGYNGWSPVLALVVYQTGLIMQVISWTGGSGAPPAAGGYIGATGIVTDPGFAINVKGAAGASGTFEIYLSNYASLMFADTAAQLVGGVVVINQSVDIAASLTVTSPVRVTSGQITINSGQVLTFNGGIDAPLTSIFLGTGTVKLNAATKIAWPEWWGATHSPSGDDSVAINAAIQACNGSATKATFCYANFTYYLQNPILVNVQVPMISMPGALILPSTSSPSSNGIIFGTPDLAGNFNYGNIKCELPALGLQAAGDFFTGTALKLYKTSLANILVGNMGENATAIEFEADSFANCLDNKIYCHDIDGGGADAAIKCTGTAAPTWASGKSYAAGMYVLDPGDSNHLYRCTTPVSSATQPHSDGTHWVTAVWISGTAYTAGQYVMDAAAPGANYQIYFCLNNVTSATAPHSDSTNWESAPVTIQGNRVEANFVVSYLSWVKYAIGPLVFQTANDNFWQADAVDMANLNGVLCFNNTTGMTINQEVFNCTGFFGGFGGTGSKLGSGVFDQCRFRFGTGGGIQSTTGIPATDYGAFGIQEQSGDAFGNEYLFGYGNVAFGHSVGVAAPIPAANAAASIATFNGGFPIGSNRMMLSFTLPGNVLAGDFQAFYVYSPMVLGHARAAIEMCGSISRGGLLLEDSTGNVMMITQIFDHTSSNPYELKIGFRNISPNTILAGTVFSCTLRVGY